MAQDCTRRLFVVSDLHLGGRQDDGSTAGTAICTRSAELAAFLDWVGSRTAAHPGEAIELVINGDLFDFLCELESVERFPEDLAADEELALRLARRIEAEYARHEAASPLTALKRLARNGVRIVLLLGNHDVELSFPRVRNWLHRLIDPPPGGLQFIYDGEAYSAGDVVIEHGNRYDPWNVINHDTLRQDRAQMSRGLLHTEGEAKNSQFVPPAGSFMVAYVINELKKQYRFLDLLKPETEAMLPFLLSLCPPAGASLRDILGVAPVVLKRNATTIGVASGRPVVKGYLRHEGPLPQTMEDWLSAVVEPRATSLFLERDDEDAPARTSRSLGASPSIPAKIRRLFVRSNAFAELLLPATRKTTLRRLHAALRALPSGTDFDLSQEAPDYEDAAHRLTAGGRFRVVIFGHTHLPKDLHWRDGAASCRYINTGTWADVIRIPAECVADDFSRAEAALHAFAEDLAHNRYRPYVDCPRTYAEVVVDGGRCIVAKLWRFDGVQVPRSTPAAR